MSTSTSLSTSAQKGFAPILIVVILVATVIAAGGYFLYSNYSNNRTKITPTNQPIQVIQPSSAPAQVSQTTPTPDETANWKIYTNKLYSFKYPNTWSLDASADKYQLLYDSPTPPHAPGYTVSFTVENVSEGVSITDPVGTKKELQYKAIEEKTGDSSLDNKPAVKVKTTFLPGSGDGIPTMGVKVPLDSSKILYIALACLKDNCDKYSSQFDQILSTFRFLP